MAYDVKAIANYFIKRSDYSISPMKLQKLIYYAHGWNLAISNVPLINNELEAWQYGPVINEIYHAVKHYGNRSISEPIEKFNPEDWSYSIPELAEDDVVKPFLDEVYNAYGQFPAIKLSEMTHAINAPWHLARSAGSAMIDNDSIKQYFVNLSTQNAEV